MDEAWAWSQIKAEARRQAVKTHNLNIASRNLLQPPHPSPTSSNSCRLNLIFPMILIPKLNPCTKYEFHLTKREADELTYASDKFNVDEKSNNNVADCLQ
ncbi:hypothetical protein U1Q18_048331 [Sarracenia purpurea var. burkii]